MSPEKPSKLRELMSVRTVTVEGDRSIPAALRVTAGYAWRFLVIAAAVGVLVWLVMQLKLIVVPLMVAILISALLWPAFEFMLRKRFPRWLAIVISLLGTIAVVGGLLWLAGWQIARESAEVRARTADGIEQFRLFLIEGPLHLSAAQIEDYLQQLYSFVQEQADLLWSGALAIGTTAGHVL